MSWLPEKPLTNYLAVRTFSGSCSCATGKALNCGSLIGRTLAAYAHTGKPALAVTPEFV